MSCFFKKKILRYELLPNLSCGHNTVQCERQCRYIKKTRNSRMQRLNFEESITPLAVTIIAKNLGMYLSLLLSCNFKRRF